MSRTFSVFVAVGFMFAGIGKMFVQATAQKTLLVPTCLGNTVSMRIGSGNWSPLHCWGCYAFGLGVVLLLLSIIWQIRLGRNYTSKAAS